MPVSLRCSYCRQRFEVGDEHKEFLSFGHNFCCIDHIRSFIEHRDPSSMYVKTDDEARKLGVPEEIIENPDVKIVNTEKVLQRFHDIDHLEDWEEAVEKSNELAWNRIKHKTCNPNDVRLIMDSPTYRSKLLNKEFRSSYEVAVIEVMHLSWGWEHIHYEAHAIKMYVAEENQERMYIPDWFDPRNIMWFEVKGSEAYWKECARQKFTTLQETVGKDRMILIHPLYGQEFADEAAKIRR